MVWKMECVTLVGKRRVPDLEVDSVTTKVLKNGQVSTPSPYHQPLKNTIVIYNYCCYTDRCHAVVDGYLGWSL